MDDLKQWLVSEGFQIGAYELRHRDNAVSWFAYRRVFEQYIEVHPFMAPIGGRVFQDVEIVMYGEGDDGTRYKLGAVGLKPEDVMVRLPEIQDALLRAWRGVLKL